MFKLFRQYEALKGNKREWDVSDLTGHVYRQLSKGVRGGLTTCSMFHYVYIDEVGFGGPLQYHA